MERKLAVVQVNFYLVNLKVWFIPLQVVHSEVLVTDEEETYYYGSGPDGDHYGLESSGPP